MEITVFGRGKWEKAEAVIIASALTPGRALTREYVADVTTADGHTFRVKMEDPLKLAKLSGSPGKFSQPVGDHEVRGVEFNRESGNARFDMSDPRNTLTGIVAPADGAGFDALFPVLRSASRAAPAVGDNVSVVYDRPTTPGSPRIRNPDRRLRRNSRDRCLSTARSARRRRPG